MPPALTRATGRTGLLPRCHLAVGQLRQRRARAVDAGLRNRRWTQRLVTMTILVSALRDFELYDNTPTSQRLYELVRSARGET